MDSLTLKIHSFLNHASSDTLTVDRKSQSALKMVKYFEEEYDLQMMSFLEKEWVTEQVERDISNGVFTDLRSHVPVNRQSGFDAIVSSVLNND